MLEGARGCRDGGVVADRDRDTGVDVSAVRQCDDRSVVLHQCPAAQQEVRGLVG